MWFFSLPILTARGAVAERLLHTQSAEGRSRGGCGRVSGAGAPGTRNAGRTQRHAAAAIPAASAEGAAHAQPRAALGTLLWRPALLRGAVECRVAGPCRMLRGSALPEWRRCGLAPRGKAARHALAECCGSRAHPVAAAARAARQRPCATPPPQGKACNSVRHDTKPRCEPPRTCYDCRYWRRSARHAQRAAGGGGRPQHAWRRRGGGPACWRSAPACSSVTNCAFRTAAGFFMRLCAPQRWAHACAGVDAASKDLQRLECAAT
jgi:hypothetical protein